MSSRLAELQTIGQSIWYDQMERSLVTEGTLASMIREDGLRGLTSNPTIFDKAIGGTSQYDEQLRKLAREGKPTSAIYETLVVDDIRDAADVFRPLYDSTDGTDGYVSLEVSPLLAHDTAGTVEEAERLWRALDRPNVMIKIPATREGIPAIERTIAKGINVNVTLIFSRERYAEVIEAYLRGLEARARQGEPVDRIASVASFFVSRIDTKADKAIESKLEVTGEPDRRSDLESLLGKVAIANAKLAYQLFLERFSGERWNALSSKGAQVQRPLWASTGTKNPSYSDVLYIESLIGPDTVNTVPPATYEAFKDHGVVERTIDQDVDDARRVLERLEHHGISLEEITRQLEQEGVRSFAESFESLIGTIESSRDVAIAPAEKKTLIEPGPCREAFERAVAEAESTRLVERIWDRDPSAWRGEEDHQAVIRSSLGWLTIIEPMQEAAPAIMKFAEEVRSSFDHVVVLGMGGSSLCAEVFRRAFGHRKGWPRLHVLDSTVPDAIRRLEEELTLARSLFVVASKSGTTTEPSMFHKYFFDRVRDSVEGSTGDHFIAITDPGTPLERLAAEQRFRRVFLNPADIGGRYSALSYFGMVPAAIAGIEIGEILSRASHAAHMARPAVPFASNDAARLGCLLAACHRESRNKLTLVTPSPLDALGLWIEQLIAESTGKDGVGILPIADEPRLAQASYGSDRLFATIRTEDGEETEPIEGHPRVARVLGDPLDLGAEFFTWEFATAVAGALLGINPFDQPDVQAAKEKTRSQLAAYQTNGRLAAPPVAASSDVADVALSGALRSLAATGGTVEDLLSQVVSALRPGQYVALMPYLAESEENDALLSRVRKAIGTSRRVATTSGYGPRFLHSTGQLHKGGADEGLFIQITADEDDVPIPEEPFGFAVLAEAQAIGDFEALEENGRRAIRIHLRGSAAEGLARLAEMFDVVSVGSHS